MTTITDELRRQLIARGVPEAELEAVLNSGGKTWNTKELQEDFEVLGFAAPFVAVRERSTGRKGALMFTHYPRFYYDWQPTD